MTTAAGQCAEPLVLGYTIRDDGVHAACETGNHERPWDRNLGFDATPQDAMAAQQAHDAEREADAVTPESLAANASPIERQVDAALAVLREEFDIGRDVLIGDYINSRTDPPPGPERDAALAAFRAANEAAEERVRAVIRRALEASAPDPINEPREA